MNRGFVYLKKALVKQASWLSAGLVLLCISACRSFFPAPNLAATPTPQTVVGIDGLRFKDPEEGRRFRALNSCITDMVDKTWQTTSYQLTGNFYESKWCRGSGVDPDCHTSESTMDSRDQHVLELNTLFYPQDYPEVFGLGLSALWAPKTTGWGASFFFAEGGGSVVGDGWQVMFREYTAPTGQPEATIYLGRGYGYRIYETSVDYSADLPLREDLAQYLAGPESMRDRGLAQIQALAQKVRAEISTHQVITCDRGPYQGGGIPPACTPRPMTPAEETAELVLADTHFADQEQLLRDHYQEMYEAWMRTFPLDQCWP